MVSGSRVGWGGGRAALGGHRQQDGRHQGGRPSDPTPSSLWSSLSHTQPLNESDNVVHWFGQ
ncbi:hypothetical protein GCM10009548_68960 [Streptomyces malaysiensis subsp. malaysiensis]